jgi:hypothetical protein
VTITKLEIGARRQRLIECLGVLASSSPKTLNRQAELLLGECEVCPCPGGDDACDACAVRGGCAAICIELAELGVRGELGEVLNV